MVKAKGYLQLELLAVVTIIALFAVCVRYSPRFLQDAALDCEARLLAAELRWLQQCAMNVAKGHSEFPSQGMGSFPVLYFRLGPQGGYSVLKGIKTLKKHQFSYQVSINGNYPPISFNGKGYINTPLTITLYQGAKQKKVIIDRVGRIRVGG